MNKSIHVGGNQRGGDSPRLLRSKSGSMSSSPLPETHYNKTKTPGKEDKKKSKKKRPAVVADGAAAAVAAGGLVVYMPRSMSRIEAPRMSRSASASPSAWALSSGRLLPSPAAKSPAPISTRRESKGGGGGVMSGVLKYFRQKKVSPLLEEEYHRYRVAYNRQLQWRFANARADASTATVKRLAQRKLLNGRATISGMRKMIVEKRCAIQKMNQEMKVYQIMKSEMRLLNQWAKLEPKNVEAVGRVVTKLSAISISLPLVQNAEANKMSVYDVISMAVEVMDNIKAMILNMYSQVEKTCFLVTELSVMLKQHQHFFQELENSVTFVASLQVQEKSLRAHHIQLLESSVYTEL